MNVVKFFCINLFNNYWNNELIYRCKNHLRHDLDQVPIPVIRNISGCSPAIANLICPGGRIMLAPDVEMTYLPPRSFLGNNFLCAIKSIGQTTLTIHIRNKKWAFPSSAKLLSLLDTFCHKCGWRNNVNIANCYWMILKINNKTLGVLL